MSHPGIAVYPEKELLIVCDRGNKRISIWDKLGNPVDTIALPQHPDCCSYAGYGILVVGTSQGEVLFIDLDCKQHVFTWTNKQLKNPGFITGRFSGEKSTFSDKRLDNYLINSDN